MGSEKLIRDYLSLRKGAHWQLLASDNGPAVLGLLQSILHDDRSERVMRGSVFHYRVAREIGLLRERGVADFPRPPRDYVGLWVGQGWLVRRLLVGAEEEEFELSTAAVDAIRTVASMRTRRVAMTESRLALVIQAVARLAEDADPDAASRLARLKEERARLDREIERVEGGRAEVLTDSAALERLREILDLALGLTEDFRRVFDQFASLHKDLRERIMIFDDSRGRVAGEVFEGFRGIRESEPGRSFEAFHRLLVNEEQQSLLARSLEGVMAADFFKTLDEADQDYLGSFVDIMLGHSMAVHNETARLAESLRKLVESAAYKERRRILDIIREAKKAALEYKEGGSLRGKSDFHLKLFSVRFGSVSQLALYASERHSAGEPVTRAGDAGVDLDSVLDAVKFSDLDYRILRENIADAVARFGRVTIGQILEHHPAEQGLGTVVGLLHLAQIHGERGAGREGVAWRGLDGVDRRARLDTWYFGRIGPDGRGLVPFADD
ncbi:MAG: DUF3375 domain-containing protein [Deltaproteobacteria bacterium]|jgi:hypothetical protein|nr:DUF3375 domain-containing protein [Deltaproteobacteria bacterium]